MMLGKRIVLGVAGLLLVGFGGGMLVKTGYGADTLNAFFTGIAARSGLSLGTINTIFNATMIFFIYFMNRKLVGIGMVLSIFVLKFPIDYAIAVYPASPNIIVGIASGILSLTVFSFGAALMIESDLGCTVYDGITLIITEKTRFPFKVVRFVCDGFALFMGILFQGEIGIGTILSFFLMAPCIDGFRKIIRKKTAVNSKER